MIATELAQKDYESGYRVGDGRRRLVTPTPISPALAASFWFQRGDADGFVGNPLVSFSFAAGAASTSDEIRAYEQGYNGQPLSLPFLAGWWESGKSDVAAGRAPTWLLRTEQIGRNGSAPAPIPNGGVIVNAPPPYSPPPPYRVPNLPPVVAYPDRYPPNEGYYPPYPRRRFRRRRPGIVITGPWGEIDLTQLAAQLGQPQTVRPGDLLDTYY